VIAELDLGIPTGSVELSLDVSEVILVDSMPISNPFEHTTGGFQIDCGERPSEEVESVPWEQEDRGTMKPRNLEGVPSQAL
jgi:hypothetical protein